jgi:hypothetical protein
MSIKQAVDYTVLDRILSSINTTNMTAMQVVNIVFERTAMTYKLQWLESEKECDRLTNVVVSKNQEIDS